MLRLHTSASAAHAKQYYAGGLGAADYYRDGGEEPGRWFGRGASRLGLAGEVTRDAFHALTDNRHPATGGRLTARDKGESRRPGWDCVFSPPKAVSVVSALTGDARIAAAEWESARETLAEIEADAVATRVRRGGAAGSAPTGNLVAALFRHDTTRELADGMPDPHDHIHAFVFNATWSETERRWQAVDPHDLHRDRPYYKAAFEARLAAKLAALGYGVERDAAGWTLAGVPADTAAKFSRRTAEVESEAARRGVADPAEKGRLGAATRRKKGPPARPDELMRYWDAKLTPGERAAVAAAGTLAAAGRDARGATAAESLAHAAEHHFQMSSVVPVRQLQTTALKFGVGSVTPEEVAAQVGRQGLLTAESGGRLLATSAEVRAEEAALIRFARDGRGVCEPLGGWVRVPREPGRLTAGQARAADALLGSFDRLQILAGKAGVGKSTLLAEVRGAAEAAGRRVIAVAPTTGAAAVLRGEGFEAATVARLLASEADQARLAGALLIVDEAGLVGTRAMARLVALAARHGARVLLSGDAGQHRSPERGAALRLLQERGGVRPAGLSEIVRQTGRFKEAVAALAGGRGGEGFDRLDALGFVHEVADGPARYRRLAEDYADTLAAGKDALAIAPTHAEGAAVTAAIRAELRARGRISGVERPVTRLESAGLTEAERRDAARYGPGDVVQFHQNAAGGWRRGERATVAAPAEEGVVRVTRGDGTHAALPLDLAHRFQVYRPRELALAAGDRVRFTANGYARGGGRLDSGAVATVAGFTPTGDIRLDGGRVVPKGHGHLAAGWAVTSHAAQGRTVSGVVFVAQSAASLPASNLEQFYVSASRAKGAGRVAVYTDDKAALRQAVSRSERPLSATDLLGGPRGASPWRAAADRLRQLRRQAEVYARRGLDAAGYSRPRHPDRAAHPRREAARER